MNQVLSSVLCFATSARVKVLEGTGIDIVAAALTGESELIWGGITRNGQKEDSVKGESRAGDHDRFIVDAGSSPEQGSRGLSPARRPDFGGLFRLAPRVPRLAEGSGHLGGLECGELHQP
jgi:hypothetical protein